MGIKQRVVRSLRLDADWEQQGCELVRGCISVCTKTGCIHYNGSCLPLWAIGRRCVLRAVHIHLQKKFRCCESCW